MITDLGMVPPGSTVRIPFHTFDSNDPSASVTTSGFAATDVEIFKDGSTTQRASDSGYTATTDFDGITGTHLLVIDLADNTTAGFWAAGSEYLVQVSSITVDAATVNFWAGRFRIGYTGAHLNTTIATLSTQTSFTLTAGPAEDDALNGSVVLIHDVASAVQKGYAVVSDYTGSSKTVTLVAGTTFTAAATDNIAFYPPVNMTHIANAAVSTSTAQIGVNVVNAGGTAWASGSLTSGVFASGAITNTAIATDAIGAAELADGAITAATFAAGAIDATAIAADAITAAKIADGAIDANTFATGAITATAIAADAIGASELAADAVTEIQSGLATSSALTTVDTNVSAILAATRAVAGTSDSGTTTTMVDAARTEADDDYWNGAIILFTSGNIAGQARVITDFVASSDTITFAPATTQAVSTQTYVIIPAGDFLRPTTSGRTLDVSSGGEAGVDWANVGSQSTSVNLSGTTVNLTNTVTTYTGNTPQTGDSYARLGAPAGASIAADIAAIEAQTDDIGTAGAGLTAVPWNAAWDAEVQSEVADALTAFGCSTVTTAEVNAEVVDALATDTYAESSGVVAATASLAAKIQWLATLARNKITQTATTQTLRNDADSGNIATSSHSDDGTTHVRSEWS